MVNVNLSAYELNKPSKCFPLDSERTEARTENPLLSKSPTIHVPMNPEAPVTRTVAGAVSAGMAQRYPVISWLNILFI